jgi:hypothetical protein
MINKLLYHINELLIILVLFFGTGNIQIHCQEDIGGL